MEENKKPVSDVFAEMDKAVEGLFNAFKKVEEKKKVFVINRTEHYKGEKPKGVEVIECFEFSDLEGEGVDIERSYARARFEGDRHHWYKRITEMSRGTILKLQAGEYIQRIK